MSIFKFKRFLVDQSDCAMKVNTDGVLLGAIAEGKSPKNILDIGTGTGVIAMMMAQRFSSAFVNGVEIDTGAAQRAMVNAQNSPFSHQIKISECSFQNYKSDVRFDLIVSNPPFYTNSLRSPNDRRAIAKHASTDFFDDFFRFCADSLEEYGAVEIIVPYDSVDQIQIAANEQKMSMVKRIDVSSFPLSKPFRSILRFSNTSIKSDFEVRKSEIAIYLDHNRYSENYIMLLAPFLIIF